jgi:hypothetical protein
MCLYIDRAVDIERSTEIMRNISQLYLHPFVKSGKEGRKIPGTRNIIILQFVIILSFITAENILWNLFTAKPVYKGLGLGSWCLMPLSTTFQLYRGSQCGGGNPIRSRPRRHSRALQWTWKYALCEQSPFVYRLKLYALLINGKNEAAIYR